MDTEALVVDAFAELGIEAQLLIGAPDIALDLVLDPGGVAAPIEVRRLSLVTVDVAERLLAEVSDLGGILLVVGDRVTGAARKLLTSRGSGYYDLRGRLALRTHRMVIDAEVEPVKGRVERTNALSGKAGLEVAAALLMQPQRGAAVRELARELGRAASTVSAVLASLRRDGLVDAKNAVADTQLFWQVADRWTGSPTYLTQTPLPGDTDLAKPLRLGLDDVENDAGWALTDSVAAAAYGAPAAVQSGQLLDFYVPDPALVRRATTLLGIAGSAASASCSVRVAPVPAVCQHRVHLGANRAEWPLAHPLFVALDLARDIGRGREILDAWTPADGWARVW